MPPSTPPHSHTTDSLLRLMHDAYCAMEDGVPLPFNRWIMDGGPGCLPDEARELRDAYDSACEQVDARA